MSETSNEILRQLEASNHIYRRAYLVGYEEGYQKALDECLRLIDNMQKPKVQAE